MSCASPRTPCSGPNSAVSLISPRAVSRSIAWSNCGVTAVGLHNKPTRRPSRKLLLSLANRASPVRTVMTSPSASPSCEDRHRLQRHFAVLGDHAKPHRPALVLGLQLALVDLQLRDEVLERHLVGVPGAPLG